MDALKLTGGMEVRSLRQEPQANYMEAYALIQVILDSPLLLLTAAMLGLVIAWLVGGLPGQGIDAKLRRRR